MKILQVIPYFTPIRGGDVNVCYHLSKALAEKGHDVTIITTDFEFDEEYAKKIIDKNLQIISFHCIINLKLFLYAPSMKRWLKNHISKFDIVHMHEFRTYQNTLIIKFADKHNIPVVLQPHNDLSKSIEKKTIKSIFDFVYGYKILKKICKTVAVSRQEFEIANNLGIDANNIKLIYNGLDVDLFENITDASNFKEKFNFSGKILLYFGRVHKSKGIDNIIYSFDNVLKRYPECNLIIAGANGEYKQQLLEIINKLHLEKKVVFYQNIDEEMKKYFFINSHILLHPVLFMGGVGLIPLEAILCETPVIVTEECGEIIEKCGCGYIVKYGDIQELTSSIIHIFENYPEAKQKAIDGRNYLLKNFAWKVVVIEYEHLYKSITR